MNSLSNRIEQAAEGSRELVERLEEEAQKHAHLTDCDMDTDSLKTVCALRYVMYGKLFAEAATALKARGL